MTVEVLCIGHACYDLNIALESFPVENRKYEATGLLEEGGGPAANAAYLLSSWGVSCAFGGVVGRDSYGERAAAEFEKAGTDISLLQLVENYETPLSVILVNESTGSRTILNRKKQGVKLHVDREALGKMDPKVMLFDGHEPDASEEALKAHPGAVTVLDAGSVRAGTLKLAPKVDYLVCSERFALNFCGFDRLEEKTGFETCLDRLFEVNRKHVVVTLGERGLIYRTAGRSGFLPAYHANAADTTAAGDIFHGAFAYGLLKDMDFEETLRLASMAAALSVTAKGGRSSIPPLDKVLAALNAQEPV